MGKSTKFCFVFLYFYSWFYIFLGCLKFKFILMSIFFDFSFVIIVQNLKSMCIMKSYSHPITIIKQTNLNNQFLRKRSSYEENILKI